MSDQTRLLTISQAADRLGISVQTLRAYADKGMVPMVKLPSGYRRFDAASVERIRQEWATQGATHPGSGDDTEGGEDQ
jgi:excisionase family DNA binding protein